jgi:hypothetical protein
MRILMAGQAGTRVALFDWRNHESLLDLNGKGDWHLDFSIEEREKPGEGKFLFIKWDGNVVRMFPVKFYYETVRARRDALNPTLEFLRGTTLVAELMVRTFYGYATETYLKI